MTEEKSPKLYCKITGKWCNNWLCTDCEEFKEYDWSGESIFQGIWEKLMIYHYIKEAAKRWG